MRKSGWAAAAGLGSVVLLLTACGGSSGSSSTSTSTSTATAQATANGEPSSNVGLPQKGSVVLVVQKSALGYVLAEANGDVVYTYGKDTKGGTPTCTGSCAAIWPPLTGNPWSARPTPAWARSARSRTRTAPSRSPTTASRCTLYKGEKPLSVKGNGIGGEWHVIKLSKSNISGG